MTCGIDPEFCYPPRAAAEWNSDSAPLVDGDPNRLLAQLVEHHLDTVGVSGSNPLEPTKM
jgi:hypothetical protein